MAILYSIPKRGFMFPAWVVTDSTIEYKKKVIRFCDIIDAEMYAGTSAGSNAVFEIKTTTKNHMILFSNLDWDYAVEAYHFVMKQCPVAKEKRFAAEEERQKQKELTPRYTYTPTSKNKDASVVGRAVVGGVVAGPVGAIVGAMSAVDKNNRNKK